MAHDYTPSPVYHVPVQIADDGDAASAANLMGPIEQALDNIAAIGAGAVPLDSLTVSGATILHGALTVGGNAAYEARLDLKSGAQLRALAGSRITMYSRIEWQVVYIATLSADATYDPGDADELYVDAVSGGIHTINVTGPTHRGQRVRVSCNVACGTFVVEADGVPIATLHAGAPSPTDYRWIEMVAIETAPLTYLWRLSAYQKG